MAKSPVRLNKSPGNSPCVKCHLRPNTWFTDEGYVCDECAEETRLRVRTETRENLLNHFRSHGYEYDGTNMDVLNAVLDDPDIRKALGPG